MTDYAQMIRELRRYVSSSGIVEWGRAHGRKFSDDAVRSVVARGSRPGKDIAASVSELYGLLITDGRDEAIEAVKSLQPVGIIVAGDNEK